MKKLAKIKKGDKVAILSPSFAAPAIFPDVYNLGLKRLTEDFSLESVEYPTTKQLNAPTTDRATDLISAFENPEIKAVLATIGGDDQVTYIKKLPKEPFLNNPKPFFGYSDNTHFMNFLWLCGVPSYYGGSIMTQFAMQGEMDDYTKEYLNYALFDSGQKELKASNVFNEVGLDWSDSSTLTQRREYKDNSGWIWEGSQDVSGITWGGCLDSIDEILRHGVEIPNLEQFENVILFTETSEEIPSADYVGRVYRALGERGILERVKGLLVGRAKAWEFDKQQNEEAREEYRKEQYETIVATFRNYNENSPIVLNVDFGHTDPQCILPYGGNIEIKTSEKKILVEY